MVDLRTAWSVLETEASLAEAPMKCAGTGHMVGSREIEIGADAVGNRYLLIPLIAGEAALEDRTGRWVQLVRATIGGNAYVALRCSASRLTRLFYLLADDVLGEVEGQASAASVAYQALQRWKELLAAATAPLGEGQLVGLLAELVCLVGCYELNPSFDLDRWAGPGGGKHDFQAGPLGVEVKATVAREGRVVGISGIEQLDQSPGSELALAWFRLEPVEPGQGVTLLSLLDRLDELGAGRSAVVAAMARVGYSPEDDENYATRAYKVVERRVYDVAGEAFPRMTRSCFRGDDLPPGVLRVRYSIDLTNEPPRPLGPRAAEDVWTRLASAG